MSAVVAAAHRDQDDGRFSGVFEVDGDWDRTAFSGHVGVALVDALGGLDGGLEWKGVTKISRKTKNKIVGNREGFLPQTTNK